MACGERKEEEGLVKVDTREESDGDTALLGANALAQSGDARRPNVRSKAGCNIMA